MSQNEEIQLSVDPRLTLSITPRMLGILEKFATFWRGQHPSERDPDVEHVGDFLRSALGKVKDYDEIFRGIRMASTTASLEPETAPGLCVEPPPAAISGPPPGPPVVPEPPLQEGVLDPAPPVVPEPPLAQTDPEKLLGGGAPRPPPIDYGPPPPTGPIPGPSFRDEPPAPPPAGPPPPSAGPAPGAPPLPKEPPF